MKRILIVKFWALGDILMATPLLTALKRAHPDSSICWLVENVHADILRGNPLIDEVITFDSRKWRRHWRYGRFLPYWRMSQALRRDLLVRRFDVVINLTAEKWWSVWFNVAPIKIGLFPRREPGLVGRLYTHAIPRADQSLVHNSRHYLRPAEVLGISGPYDERLVLGVSSQARAQAQAFLQEGRDYPSDKPLIILHPGTSQDSKCWPADHFAAVAAALTSRCTVIITGSPKERALAERIVAALPPGVSSPRIAAGVLPDLQTTMALIEAASAVVTGDTSALHIGAALGTPLVGIYGSTRPTDNVPQFGPHVLLYDDAVPCAPCYKADCPLTGSAHLRCQRAVTPTQVLAALAALMKETHELSPTR